MSGRRTNGEWDCFAKPSTFRDVITITRDSEVLRERTRIARQKLDRLRSETVPPASANREKPSTYRAVRVSFTFSVPSQTEILLGSDPYRKAIVLGGNNGDWYYGWQSPLTTLVAYRWINQSMPITLGWSDLGEIISWPFYGFSNVPGTIALMTVISQQGTLKTPWDDDQRK